MQSPPPFAPARKNNNTVLIVVLVILGCMLLCCGGMIFLGLSFWNKIKGFASCEIRYAETYRAINHYVAAKKHYPPAATWQDDIIPYWDQSDDSKSAGKILDMGDPRKELGCSAGEGSPATGMAYNSLVAGKTPAKIPSLETKLLFEVPTTGRNQAMPYKTPPDRSPQTILGRRRQWIYWTVNGTSSNRTSGSSFRASSSFDEQESAPKDLAKDADENSDAPVNHKKKPAEGDDSGN